VLVCSSRVTSLTRFLQLALQHYRGYLAHKNPPPS
jgi:hypothetical protein